MGPVVLWLVRIGAVALSAISGVWLANTTPSWQEDSAREELSYRWGHLGLRNDSSDCLTGGCLYNLLFPRRWNLSGPWWPGLLRGLIAIAAIACALIGWPLNDDLYSHSHMDSYEDVMLLFEPSTWVLLGSSAAGYVAGIVLRKQQY
jgi:hypothetical protein